MDKNRIMMETSIKEEGIVAAAVKIKMYAGRDDSGWVSMLMIIPIVHVTDMVSRMDENRAIYYSMN